MLRTRRLQFALLLATGAFFTPASSRAQLGLGDITNDPFAFYYAYYLPNQQMQAMRPRPDDSINMAVQQRQYYAATQRPTLYDPISPYTSQAPDPTRPYSRDQARERSANPYRFAQSPSNANGTGPSLYYGRAAQYFPTLRSGRGPNSNVSAGARRMGGGGMNMGMGGGMGMPSVMPTTPGIPG